jgi:hypothetical protein
VKRSSRIALNILCPPAMGAGFILLSMAAVELTQNGLTRPVSPAEIGTMVFFSLIMAYVIATLPSIAHAALMEWIYRRSPPHTWAAVGFSALSGFFSATLIFTIMLADSFPRVLNWNLLLFPGAGTLVGLALGGVIKLQSSPDPSSPTVLSRPADTDHRINLSP